MYVFTTLRAGIINNHTLQGVTLQGFLSNEVSLLVGYNPVNLQFLHIFLHQEINT